MYQKKIEDDYMCPLEYALEIFGGKWRSRIYCLLINKGPLRYSKLRCELEGISDPVLSSTLKELMGKGIVERKSYDEMPLRVEYNITEKGFSARPLLQSICKWSATYDITESDVILKQCQSCEYYKQNKT